MWELIKNLSFSVFGKSLDDIVPYFENISGDLKKSNLPLSLVEYVYITVFITLFSFVIEFPLIAFILSFFTTTLLAFFLSFTVSIFITLIVFFAFYSYPTLLSEKRKKNIDASLPFATIYMATISGSQAPPSTMFKVLSQFEEYGETTKEMRQIYRDTEMFGMELTAAIRKTAERTPSYQLKELLWGLTTVLTTGSDITSYLREKTKGFIQEHKRKLKEYSQRLSMLIEVYLTLVILGSIFFVVLSSIMSMFSTEMNTLISFAQFVVIFFILPAMSIGFILILRAISPSI